MYGYIYKEGTRASWIVPLNPPLQHAWISEVYPNVTILAPTLSSACLFIQRISPDLRTSIVLHDYNTSELSSLDSNIISTVLLLQLEPNFFSLLSPNTHVGLADIPNKDTSIGCSPDDIPLGWESLLLPMEQMVRRS